MLERELALAEAEEDTSKSMVHLPRSVRLKANFLLTAKHSLKDNAEFRELQIESDERTRRYALDQSELIIRSKKIELKVLIAQRNDAFSKGLLQLGGMAFTTLQHNEGLSQGGHDPAAIAFPAAYRAIDQPDLRSLLDYDSRKAMKEAFLESQPNLSIIDEDAVAVTDVAATMKSTVSKCIMDALVREKRDYNTQRLNAKLKAQLEEEAVDDATKDTEAALASRGSEPLTMELVEERLAKQRKEHEKALAALEKKFRKKERSNTSGRSTGQGSKADNSDKSTDNGSSNSSSAKNRKRSNKNRRGQAGRGGRGNGAQHSAGRRS